MLCNVHASLWKCCSTWGLAGPNMNIVHSQCQCSWHISHLGAPVWPCTVPTREGSLEFELKIPDYLRNEGISKVKLQANFYKVYLYQKGWHNSESAEIGYKETRKVALVHDVIHLLDYDNKPCIDDLNYRNDICRQNFIYRVSIVTDTLFWIL